MNTTQASTSHTATDAVRSRLCVLNDALILLLRQRRRHPQPPPQPPQAAATSPDQTAQTEAPPTDSHKKHGVGALIEKIVHPIHGSDHTHSHTEAVSVPVAVPEKPSDGGAHLAPGGSAVGGIL
ncbi:hypothetical protein MVEN_01114200 [Mycena venus]|uniref:Uncharacterized protein n=1 Tax=Mycena venus TaxID=2733690 RepID=A0A8H6Y9D2_9AGAR|nr:hypothetical protein MVEN_01114200 [Mycena venus]